MSFTGLCKHAKCEGIYMSKKKDVVIAVAYCRLDKMRNKVSPIVMHIPNRLEVFQSLVGGLIEHLSITNEIDLICNDEGKLQGLPITCILHHEGQALDFIAGDFILCGHDEDGNFADVPDFETCLPLIEQYAHLEEEDRDIMAIPL